MRESTVINAWIDEGRAKGIDEGKDKGRVEALQQTLRILLTKRFGPVSVEVLRRIDATTDPAKLDRAFTLAFDVVRPEDLAL